MHLNLHITGAGAQCAGLVHLSVSELLLVNGILYGMQISYAALFPIGTQSRQTRGRNNLV